MIRSALKQLVDVIQMSTILGEVATLITDAQSMKKSELLNQRSLGSKYIDPDRLVAT